MWDMNGKSSTPHSPMFFTYYNYFNTLANAIKRSHTSLWTIVHHIHPFSYILLFESVKSREITLNVDINLYFANLIEAQYWSGWNIDSLQSESESIPTRVEIIVLVYDNIPREEKLAGTSGKTIMPNCIFFLGIKHNGGSHGGISTTSNISFQLRRTWSCLKYVLNISY